MRNSVLAASVLAVALSAAPSDAATDPKATPSDPQQATAKTREQGWVAQCTSAARGTAPDCAVNQRVLLANTGQLLAAITIRVPSKTRKPVMMVHAPLGLYLPPGVRIAVGKGKALTVPLQTCDNKGCYAGQPISAELLKQFRSGKEVVLAFQNVNRQDIKITISLKGFAEAFDKVK